MKKQKQKMLRRKNKYWIIFILSLSILVLLLGIYLYTYYNQAKNEQVSKEILLNIDFNADQINDDTTLKSKEQAVHTSENYQDYSVVAILNIPKIKLEYPVLSHTSDQLLKISINKYWGPEPNEVGNFCMVGHNYKNNKFFSKIDQLTEGDRIELTDNNGRKEQYSVYTSYLVEPNDVSCTSQHTDEQKEITLITCSRNGKHRLVVKARIIENK